VQRAREAAKNTLSDHAPFVNRGRRQFMVGRPATQRGELLFLSNPPGRQAGAATVFRWRSTRVFGTEVAKIAPFLPRPCLPSGIDIQTIDPHGQAKS
jgi:hypothetical protein